jgi:hypothetical protein
MNYFAHGREFIEQPYVLAGTAVPDWLSVVDRRVRVRSRNARRLVDDPDPRIAAVARGIVRHHDDDQWFHRTPAFAELSWRFTLLVRDALSPDPGLRPSFLGHILVELLLDAALIAEQIEVLEAYYEAVDRLDSGVVADTVHRIAQRCPDQLAWFIRRFHQERFLFDYLDDRRLLYRLNQVMRRARLAALPEALLGILPEARQAVTRRKDELLTPADRRSADSKRLALPSSSRDGAAKSG